MLKFGSTIDLDLRKERAALYVELWRATGVLPKWPPDTTVSYDRMLRFSGALREWYFAGGGMYFSSESREAYERLQDTIWDVYRAATKDSDAPTQTLAPEHYEVIRSACSVLRTRMTDDLLSQRPAPPGASRCPRLAPTAT